jgi:SPP1 family predicted phage head-tail adaptor
MTVALAGAYDRVIEIQAKRIVLDDAGQEVEEWVTVWRPHARMRPFHGGERFTAQQIVGKAVVTFEIRHRPGVTVLHRILFEGRSYDIHDIRELGRREALEIDTTVAVPVHAGYGEGGYGETPYGD